MDNVLPFVARKPPDQPSRFIQHANRYRQTYLHPEIAEPLWDISDLSEDEQLELGNAVLAALAGGHPLGEWFTNEHIFWMVLQDYGIRCPCYLHLMQPLADGKQECSACGKITVLASF